MQSRQATLVSIMVQHPNSKTLPFDAAQMHVARTEQKENTRLFSVTQL